MSETPINPKQAAFCCEWIIDHNGTQAAIRAGYARKGARVRAVRLLSKDNIKTEIARLKAYKTADSAEEGHNRRQAVLDGIDEGIALARAKGNLTALARFIELSGKTEAMFVERVQTDDAKTAEVEENLKAEAQAIAKARVQIRLHEQYGETA